MKILAIKLRAIGDTVIWTSALKALHQAHPQADIHTLTYEGNKAVLLNQKFVSKTHFLQGKGKWELARVLWRLRKEQYDWLLAFHATTSLCRWAWLTGAGHMALHHHSWPYTPRGSVPVPAAGQLEDAITRDFRVLNAMGVATRIHPPTELTLTDDERTHAQGRVNQTVRAYGGDPLLPKFLFLPGAGHVLRRYPFDLWWPEVLRMRENRRDQPIVVVDDVVAKEWNLAAMCEREHIPLITGGSLREFIAHVSVGARALANDSGPGHIAVALGLKTDFIFGPGCVGDWHCYDSAVHPAHRVKVPCRSDGPREEDKEQFQFCTVDICKHHRCMREIPRPVI